MATLKDLHCSILWLETGILKSLFPNNWSGDESVTRNRQNNHPIHSTVFAITYWNGNYTLLEVPNWFMNYFCIDCVFCMHPTTCILHSCWLHMEWCNLQPIVYFHCLKVTQIIFYPFCKNHLFCHCKIIHRFFWGLLFFTEELLKKSVQNYSAVVKERAWCWRTNQADSEFCSLEKVTNVSWHAKNKQFT